MTDIVVSTGDDSPEEEIAEAVEQVAEQQQSFDIGVLVGKMEALEDKVNYHDALIQLHSHDGLATQDESTAQLIETENRLVDKIESLVENDDVMSEAEEQAVLDNGEVAESNESEAEQVEESNDDEPPKSRAKRTPLAERYYKSSKL